MPQQLKFSHDLPLWLETRLLRKHDYYIYSRVYNDCIVFQKKPKQGELVVVPKLQPDQQISLMTRCDRIVDFFPDPYSAVMAVRQRLHNMSQGLSMAERQFVVEYMDENFPESDRGK